jgi:parvulin-like peptidyl-prolyl isomerase
MRTVSTVLVISLLTGVWGCGWFQSPTPVKPPTIVTPDGGPTIGATTRPATHKPPVPVQRAKPEQIMALVNDKPIGMNELHSILVDGYGLTIAQQILRSEIVRQAAASKNISVTDAEAAAEHERALTMTFPMANSDAERQQMLNQLLTSRNVTFSTWGLIMRRNALLRKMIGTDFEVPDEAVRASFDKRHGRQVVVSHIETKEHVVAKLVKSLATKPQCDFAALAREYSINPSGKSGGRLPAIGPNTKQVSPALKQVALAMTKIGEISDPVQVANRFHILKLEEIIEPKQVNYAEEKGKIAAELKEQMIRSGGARLLQKLSEAAKVEFVNPSLKQQLQRQAGED